MKVVVENQQRISGWFKSPYDEPAAPEVSVSVFVSKDKSATTEVSSVDTTFLAGVTSWTFLWNPQTVGDYRILAKAYLPGSSTAVATKAIKVQVRNE